MHPLLDLEGFCNGLIAYAYIVQVEDLKYGLDLEGFLLWLNIVRLHCSSGRP